MLICLMLATEFIDSELNVMPLVKNWNFGKKTSQYQINSYWVRHIQVRMSKRQRRIQKEDFKLTTTDMKYCWNYARFRDQNHSHFRWKVLRLSRNRDFDLYKVHIIFWVLQNGVSSNIFHIEYPQWWTLLPNPTLPFI